VAWAIIAFGALVRLRQYLGARSLRYDEARVAYEIAQRSLVEMLDASGFIRVAPPGWFVLEKLSLMAFGTGELALRLVPFVTGLIALPLFWIVPRRYLGAGVALVCAALGAVSEHVVFYTSEVKQYSSDVMWCLLVLLVLHPLLQQTTRRRSWTVAAVTGAISIWFSQPVLFVLAACGLVLFADVLRSHRADLKRTVVLGASWLGSLALNYVFILRSQAGRSDLIRYWIESFPPRGEGKMAQLVWLNERIVEYVDIPAGLYSFGLVVFGVIVGIVALFFRRRPLASIIVLVFALTLAAAGLQLYPFRDRLLLFTVPLFLIVVSTGIDQLNTIRTVQWLRPGIVLLLLLIAQPLLRAVRMIRQPEGREEIKAAMNYAVERMNADDGIYLGSGAYGAYTWYDTWTDDLRNPRDRTFQGADVNVGADSVRAEIEQLRRYRRVWMVFVDYYDADVQTVLQQIEPIAVRRDEFQAPGAITYLYEFTVPPDTSVAPPERAIGR
jgi:uncharacterized membrane protein